jgi:Ca-activated chloride channel family protein
VLLLTDGMPTDDSTAESLAALARSFRPDVSTTTLGYGPKHNAAILDSIAQAGGGQYWYIPDPSEADVEFARALGAQCDVVADGVELVLTPGPGVEIAEVLGRAKTRVTAEGVVVPRPDMRAHEQLTTVVRLLVHVDLEPGRLLPLRVTAHHRRAGETTVQTVSTDVVVAGGHGEGELDIDVHRKVTLARAEQRREDAWKEAECRRFTQAIELLEGAIEDLRALPGHQPQDGSDVSEAIEQLFDEVRMYSRAPSREDCFAFRSSTRGTEFTQGTRHPADHAMASAKSRALFAGVLDHGVGGAVWVSSRAAAPQVFPLLPEMTIGRGHNNVIPVLDSDVSRRHARLFCKDGQVFVVDLQSVTGTTVNGERIRTTRALRPGDVVCVGNTHIEVSLSPTR